MLLPLDTLAALLYLGLLELRPAPESFLAPYESLTGLPVGTLALLFDLTLLCITVGAAFITGLIARAYPSWRGDRSPAFHDRGRAAILSGRVACVLLFVFLMEGSTWPHSIPRLITGSSSLLFAQLVGILTFVGICLANWIPLYPLHARISAGEWSFRSYLLHRVRYTFFLLGLWVPLLILAEFLPSLGVLVSTDVDVILGMGLHLFVLLPLVIWLFPLFLRLFWGCRPLEAGPLRDRIEALQSRGGVRFGEIHVWDFGGSALVNAAAVGAIPPFRYLFLSKGLLRHLNPEEIEAVVGHEMGHVRHHHILFYAVVTFSTFSALAFLIARPALPPVQELLLLLGGMLLYFRLVFGFLSRHFEREADLFSLEVTGSATPLCRALERIALISGNIRSAPSWHHGSIAARVRFLQSAESTPAIVERHEAAVRHLRRLGYLFAGIVLLSMVASSLSPKPAPQPEYPGHTRFPASPDLRKALHWRRVARFLPDDPAGPLGLARIHLAHDSSRPALRLALAYATEAERRADAPGERTAAEEILKRIHTMLAAPETSAPDMFPDPSPDAAASYPGDPSIPGKE